MKPVGLSLSCIYAESEAPQSNQSESRSRNFSFSGQSGRSSSTVSSMPSFLMTPSSDASSPLSSPPSSPISSRSRSLSFDLSVANSLTSKSLQAVYFDHDGTLGDSEALVADTFCDVIKGFISRTDTHEYASPTKYAHNYAGITVDKVIADYVAKGILSAPHGSQALQIIKAKLADANRSIKSMPGAMNMLEDFSRINKKWASMKRDASAPLIKSRIVTSDSKKNTITKTVATGSQRYFSRDRLQTSDETPGRLKPMPDPYLEAARADQVQPENCIVLEDSPAGIESAKLAGMQPIAYNSSKKPAEIKQRDSRELMARGAKVEINHWNQLPHILEVNAGLRAPRPLADVSQKSLDGFAETLGLLERLNTRPESQQSTLDLHRLPVVAEE